MSLKLGKNQGGVQAKLNRYLMPNIVYLIEIEKRLSKHIVARYAVHQKPDDVFTVSETSYNKSFAINETVFKELKSFPHQLGARQYIEQLVTQAEMDGYEYRDEFEQPLFDVTTLPLLSKQAEVLVAADFFREHHLQAAEYTVQGVKGGVLSYLFIDPQGVITFRTGSAPGAVMATLTEGDMYNYFKAFFALPGFRGAIFEVIYNSTEFAITDCVYLCNKWINHMSITERFNALSNAVNYVGLDISILAKPQSISARDWLMVNNRGVYKGMLVKQVAASTAIVLDGFGFAPASSYLLTQTPAAKITISAVMGELSSLLCANTLKPLCNVHFPKQLAKKYVEFTMAGFVGGEKRTPIFI
ncbi:hypothetical protein [Rheinheimera hassiensis]|uniref:hypothetical protein n=1 Tax=Rheinheimera hassiensis TaxID=1193627 RepID=UPI001F06DECE|nr:hypothetical protein [Rheinheimera hassiensis]